MRKYSVLIFSAILIFCALNTGAEEEKPVFESLRCGICHKADTGRIYPSLKEIATAYKGNSEDLKKYLHGESESIVNQEKSKIMERYIEKTKALSKEELKSLVDFILSNKE